MDTSDKDPEADAEAQPLINKNADGENLWNYEYPTYEEEPSSGHTSRFLSVLITALALHPLPNRKEAGLPAILYHWAKRLVFFGVTLGVMGFHISLDKSLDTGEKERSLNIFLDSMRVVQFCVSWVLAYQYIRTPTNDNHTAEKEGQEGRPHANQGKSGWCKATDSYDRLTTFVALTSLTAIFGLGIAIDFTWNWFRVTHLEAPHRIAVMLVDIITTSLSFLFWCLIAMQLTGVFNRIHKLVPQVKYSNSIEIAVHRHQAVLAYMKSVCSTLCNWMVWVLLTNFVIVFCNAVNFGFGGSSLKELTSVGKQVMSQKDGSVLWSTRIISLILPLVLYSTVLYVWRKDFVRPVNELESETLPEGSCLAKRRNVNHLILYHNTISDSYGKSIAMRVGWFPMDLKVGFVGLVVSVIFVGVKVYADYSKNHGKASFF